MASIELTRLVIFYVCYDWLCYACIYMVGCQATGWLYFSIIVSILGKVYVRYSRISTWLTYPNYS